MGTSNAAARRLLAIHNHTNGGKAIPENAEGLIVVLPRGGNVTARTTTDISGTLTQLRLNKTPILDYHVRPNISLTFELSSVGTRYEGATTHLPKYNGVEASAKFTSEDTGKPSNCVTIHDIWAAIYALFTIYHTQEYIPLTFTSIANEGELRKYLIISGLGRAYQGNKLAPIAADYIFLSKAAFWQGAGTTGYHNRGWLLSPAPVYPSLPSFTRSDMVIASHPLRPPKPQPGEILYRRYCAAVGQTLEIVSFDLEGPEGRAGADNGLSKHMAAFHKWHNDERVNSAWGERGSLETHREYIEGLLRDPGVVPCMMSWDGELMGYVEIVWVKENHAGQYYPADVTIGEWERGVHVLVGEDKFRGVGRCKSYPITSLVD